MFEPNTTFAFGEEGLHCPKCGAQADWPIGSVSIGGVERTSGSGAQADWPIGSVFIPEQRFVARCLSTVHCGVAFFAGFADPQCGECREFLDDPNAEDDSLCPTCKTKD